VVIWKGRPGSLASRGASGTNLPAFHHGLLVCAGVAVAAAVAALTVRDADAASTMVRPPRRSAAAAAVAPLSAEDAPVGTTDQ
jgi:hypothetical protein